jgi:hypothetical protein
MRIGRPISPLALTDDERETLESWARHPPDVSGGTSCCDVPVKRAPATRRTLHFASR